MTLDYLLLDVVLIFAAVLLVASVVAHLYVLRAARLLDKVALKLANPVVEAPEQLMEIAPGQWAPARRRPFELEGKYWKHEAEGTLDDPWFKP